MKPTFYLWSVLLLGLTGTGAARVPQKAPLSNYAHLSENSPFTSKPELAQAGPEINPLDDYALIGVSSIGKVGGSEGYRVTLINKKKPEERITVTSGDASSDFKILTVTPKPGNPLETVVKLSSGSMTGTVTFEERHLTLTAPVARAVPGAVPPGVPQLAGVPPANGQRQPRPRIMPVPPPPIPGQGLVPPPQIPQRVQRR